MRWDNMSQRGYVVPNELFFVRNHTRTPPIDVSTWRLRVEGSCVQCPFELTYETLLSMPSVSVIWTVECAGNGRSFFEQAYGKKAQGTQWKLGAVGVAEWTGGRPGHYTIRVRAADDQGHLQPDSVPWNEQGYLYKAVFDHPLVVT